MTGALRISRKSLATSRRKALVRRQRALLRSLFRAMLWGSLAYVSLAAFKLAQVRIQPDAVATGIPGFLFRLVIRPLEWASGAIHGSDPALLSLQLALAMAICGVAARKLVPVRWSLGGGL